MHTQPDLSETETSKHVSASSNLIFYPTSLTNEVNGSHCREPSACAPIPFPLSCMCCCVPLASLQEGKRLYSICLVHFTTAEVCACDNACACDASACVRVCVCVNMCISVKMCVVLAQKYIIRTSTCTNTCTMLFSSGWEAQGARPWCHFPPRTV